MGFVYTGHAETTLSSVLKGHVVPGTEPRWLHAKHAFYCYGLEELSLINISYRVFIQFVQKVSH